jgi:hypothetical protein
MSRLWGGERGASETTGVVLLTAIVVVLSVSIGGLIVSDTRERADDQRLGDFEVELTGETVTIVHNGGDTFDVGRVDVRLTVDGTELTFSPSAANLSGSDGRFAPGETLQRAHDLPSGVARVVVVHTDSNTVLVNVLREIPSPSILGGLEWTLASDWNGATSQRSVVHADFGDHTADGVELGSSADESALVGYWSFDGGSATDATGHGNDGTVNGATTGVTGVANTTAYDFDGDDAVTVADSSLLDSTADTDAFSAAYWINTTDSEGTEYVVGRYDGLGTDSGNDDFVTGLRDGNVSTFVANGSQLESNVSESAFTDGTKTNTTLSEGALELGRNRAVAYGNFSVPDSTGTMSVSEPGFEPDLVVFRTVVTGSGYNETTEVGGQALGTGHGYADCTDSGCTEVAQSVGSGSASPNAHAGSATTRYSVQQVVTDADGDTHVGTVNGTVTTDAEGFDVQFDDVAAGPTVQVRYRAYDLPDGASVDVGAFRTPSDGTTGEQRYTTGFQPNYLELATTPTLTANDSHTDNDATEFGWSLGWAIRNESRSLTSQTTTLGETGTVTTSNGTWQPVEFDNSYENPVVVGTTNTHDGASALTFEAKNVEGDSAEVRVCETEGTSDGCDSDHGEETVGYVVIDAAAIDDADPAAVEGLEAGTVSIGEEIDTNTTTVTFDGSYGSAPIVLANVQTDNGTRPTEARVTDTSASDFTVGICHQESVDSCDPGHDDETVGWVAIDPGADVFDQAHEVGSTGTSVANSEWTAQSFSTTFSAAPVAVASTQTDNGGQETQIDEVDNVTTTGMDVRYCEIEGSSEPDACDTHTSENVGWLAVESDATLTVTTESVPEQVVLSQSAYAQNIDDHVVAANDEQVIHTLWTNKDGIDGRVEATLAGYERDGFTLDYTTNDPDTADGSRFLVTYLAVNVSTQPTVGYARTPTSTGRQTLSLDGSTDAVSFAASNTIPDVDTEQYAGSNENSNHWGWSFGGTLTDGSQTDALGYSSHSNSVNEHATTARADRAFDLLYTDQNGNVLGNDSADFERASGESLTLNWTETTTSSTGDVAYDRSLFVYHSLGIERTYKRSGNYTGSFDAGSVAYWNGTELTATTPSGTSVDVDYSDGSEWYDTVDGVSRSQQLEYNVTVTSDGSATPSFDRLNATYRTQNASADWATDTESEWNGGTFDDTSTDGTGNLTFASTGTVGEAGTITTSDGQWVNVSFTGSHDNAIVVGTTNTHNDESALTFDAKNVSADSAEMRVCESEGDSSSGCDGHDGETVGYLVANETAFDAEPGVAAGTTSVGPNNEEVTFEESFDSPPVVLANVQSVDGDQPVEARVTSTSAGGFDVRICHQDSTDGCDGDHGDETVGWVAFEPGTSPFAQPSEVGQTGTTVADSEWTSQSFDANFSDAPVVVASTLTEEGTQDVKIDEARSVTADGVDVRYCELQSGDTCDTHNAENVGWLAVSSGTLSFGYEQGSDPDYDVPVGEAGTVTSNNDGDFETVDFRRNYTDPVVVGTTNTHNGDSALTFDVKTVENDSAAVRVCESDGSSSTGCESHAAETVGYLVVNASATEASANIDAGTVSVGEGIDSSQETVPFNTTFDDTPIVLANVQTTNGDQPVETRVTDTTADSFTVGICHQGSTNACDGSHVNETVGWVAIDSDAVAFAQAHDVGSTGNTVANSEWTNQSFSADFSSDPVVVVSTQTEDGGEEVQIDEARSVTADHVEVRYCELEADGDDCDTHTTETVGWLAAEAGNLSIPYTTAGGYERQFTASQEVDWTDATVSTTTPAGTRVNVTYSDDGSTWYDSAGAVPDSRSLTVNVTLLSTSTAVSPRVDSVTVGYERSGWQTTDANVSDGDWHHVAVTYDGTTLTQYVDGEQVDTATVETDIDAGDAALEIGGDSTASSYLDGRLDEVRLSNRSLSATAVRRLYNVSTNGSLTTDYREFDDDVAVANLTLETVDADVPSDTDVTVVVESDPDTDGTFEETSDTISLDGSGGSYDVTGLPSESRRYRLRVTLETTDQTDAPRFGGGELVAD